MRIRVVVLVLLASSSLSSCSREGREPVSRIRSPLSTGIVPDEQAIDKGTGATWSGPVVLTASSDGNPTEIIWDFDDGSSALVCSETAGGNTPACQGEWCELTQTPFPPVRNFTAPGSQFVAGDFDSDGTIDVAVISNAAIALLRGNGIGGFAPKEDLEGGGNDIVVGDFDSDGAMDLATVTGAGTSVHLGAGDGTFPARTDYSGGGNALATADFNEDGALDLVFAEGEADTVGIGLRFGNGDGTFGVRSQLLMHSGATLVETGDFDGNGHADVVVQSASSAGQTILSRRFGNGDGTFGPPSASTPAHGNVEGLSVADLEGDGFDDLVFTMGSPESLGVFRSNGVGGWIHNVYFLLFQSNPTGATVTDVNGDGVNDVIVAHGGKQAFTVLFGSVTNFPHFADYVGYAVNGSGTTGVRTTDLNGDGVKDVMLLQPNNSRVASVLGSPGGGFGDRTLLPVLTDPQAFAIGDLNGDGFDDYAVTKSGNLRVHHGAAPGRFNADATTYATGTNPRHAVSADLSRDGIDDLVTSNNGSNSISVFLGTTGGLAARVDYPVASSPTATVIADVNEDGRQDLLVSNGMGSASLSVFLASGAEGAFAPKVDYQAGPAPASLAVADVNGDDNLDVVLPTNDGPIAVLLGDGTGVFGPRTEYPTGVNPKALVLGDLDGDGDVDVVTANSFSANISVLLGAGDGSFPTSVSYPSGTTPQSVALRDFDLDGFLDVVVANQGSGTVSIFPGNGDGTLDPRQDISVGADARGVVVVDLSGDSGSDIVVLNAVDLNYLQLTVFEIQPTWSCAASTSHVYLDSKGTGPGPQFTFHPRLSVSTTAAPIEREFAVTVSDVPPLVTLGTSPVAEGSLAVLATSWEHPCTNDAYVMNVDWGDGADSVVSTGIGVKGAGATHLYGNGGSYPVSVIVTDDEGTSSAVLSFVQDVFDAPILLNSVQTNSPEIIGSFITVTAVLENNQGDLYTYDFDWDGDGDYFGVDDVLGSTEPSASLARTMPEVATVGVRIHDDEGNLETGSVVVQWIGTNGGGSGSPPNAVDQAFETDEDEILAIPTASLLVGAFDPDGDAIYFASAGQPAHGSLELSGSTLTYEPDLHFHGVDSFFFQIVDAFGASGTATAFVTVSSVNQPPVPSPDSLVTSAGRKATTAASWLAANDTDVDGDALTVVGVLSAVNGAVVMTGGTVSFTPAAGFSGAAGFEYSVTDGTTTATGTVTVTVLEGNASPTAAPDALATTEGVPVTVDLAVLLANDSDPEGDAISFASVGQGGHGVVAVSGSSLTYTPEAAFSGTDSFFYTIVDTLGASAIATVTVTVTAVNHAPVPVPDSAVTSEGAALDLADSYLLANDADPDGDPIAVTAVVALSNCAVTLSAGVVTVTPAAGFAGLASFSYTVSDGSLDVTATVFVSVLDVAHIPGVPGLVSPMGGTTVVSASPTLEITPATDADGDDLQYEFEIDRVATFDGSSLQQSGLIDATEFVPAALAEDVTWYWRARAHDGASAGNWGLAHFQVNATNAAPTAPVAIAPVNGQVVDPATLELRVLDAEDPDGTERTYLFTVTRDAAGLDVVETSLPIPEGATETRWEPTGVFEQGTTYFWTARAVDDEGLEGAPSPLESFAISGDGGSGGGCACSVGSNASPAPAFGTLAALAGLVFASFRMRRDA